MTLETVNNDPEYSAKSYSARSFCKYNPDGVLCAKNGRQCWKCGWNPTVEGQRIEKMKQP